jgi:hypothetical protein
VSLFTDSDIIADADLTALDSEVELVAAACDPAIDTSQMIRTAWDETADRIFEKMDSFGGSVNLLVGAGVQMATLLTNYGMGVSRSRIFLTQVLADDGYANRTSMLRRYLTYKALEAFYRDAAERLTTSDRYDRKRARFEKESALAWRRFSSKGLPIVLTPLPCPGALHEIGSGTWGGGNVSAVAAGGAIGGIWDVAITWVDQSLYQTPATKFNAESGPSALASSITTIAAHALSVSIAGLKSPNGKSFQSGTFADGILAMLNATGWNVYAGPTGGQLTLQNAAPIAVATLTYALAGDPTATGAPLGQGQTPDANYAFINAMQRG